MKQKSPMPTIWEVPDDLWGMIEVWLQATDPPKPTGRKKADRRRAFAGILFRLRTGCQWNRLPSQYGEDRTMPRYFQRWGEEGLFEQVWAVLVELCDEWKAVHWEGPAADTMLGQARMGGDPVGPNPTDRAQNGSQRRRLVDPEGGPLSSVVGPANRLEETSAAIVVDRPSPTKKAPQPLCLDKAALRTAAIPHKPCRYRFRILVLTICRVPTTT